MIYHAVPAQPVSADAALLGPARLCVHVTDTFASAEHVRQLLVAAGIPQQKLAVVGCEWGPVRTLTGCRGAVFAASRGASCGALSAAIPAWLLGESGLLVPAVADAWPIVAGTVVGAVIGAVAGWLGNLLSRACGCGQTARAGHLGAGRYLVQVDSGLAGHVAQILGRSSVFQLSE